METNEIINEIIEVNSRGRREENKKEGHHTFYPDEVKIFTEMLNDLRFPILNEVCNNELLEKKEIYLRIQEMLMNGYIEENINNFVKAYERLLKENFIKINSDNKIESTLIRIIK